MNEVCVIKLDLKNLFTILFLYLDFNYDPWNYKVVSKTLRFNIFVNCLLSKSLFH